MELILKKDVDKLGYKDDIVKVRDGYGRNFLIPQGAAVIANESAKKMLVLLPNQRAMNNLGLSSGQKIKYSSDGMKYRIEVFIQACNIR
mgnify:CR=1 FL=1